MRKQARDAGLWLPHMPAEWGGMGLGHVQLAMVQAEAAKATYGPWVFNCQAPDEGNMHTLLHWGTDEQKEAYLRPLCEGTAWSCFAMTEPEVAGSDPTLIQTRGYQDGDEWVINGHKWFISNAHRANFAILICRTEDDPDLPQAANTAFIVDLPHEGWTEVRQIETMHGSTGTARSASRTSGSTSRRCSAVAARATCSASTASDPPASPTACAGSPRPRQRWT
jgi:acyl-CoA dehydrogenase